MSSFPTWDDVLSNYSFCFIFWGRVKLAETANYLRIGWRAQLWKPLCLMGETHGFPWFFPWIQRNRCESGRQVRRSVPSAGAKTFGPCWTLGRQSFCPTKTRLGFPVVDGFSGSTLNGYFSMLHYVQYFAVNGGNVLTTFTINAYMCCSFPHCVNTYSQ